MADSKTWLDVTDTAIKIGLGAAITGIISVCLLWLKNKHDRKVENKRAKQRILEEVLELVDKFNQSASVYLANRANAAWKIEDGQKLTSKEKEDLSIQNDKLFNDFTIINTCRAKLLLIGADKAEVGLSNYENLVIRFFKIASLTNEKCTESNLLSLKGEINEVKRSFYSQLNEKFEM